MLVCWQFGRALYGGEVNSAGIANIRNPYFRQVYAKTQSLVNSGQSMDGTLFWQVRFQGLHVHLGIKCAFRA